MSNKVNPNIVKLSSLAVTGKEIEFDYKLRNEAEFELRFKEKLSLHFIEQFTRLENEGFIEMNVENNKVTIIFNEQLTPALYKLKGEYEEMWRKLWKHGK